MIHFVLSNGVHRILYFEDLELHIIELNKFTNNPKEELSDLLLKINTFLDCWITFLTRNDLLHKDTLPKALNHAPIQKAMTVLEAMNFNSEERDFYEDHFKWLRIETNTLKKMRDDSLKEGIVKGEAIGMVKGKMEEKIEIAQKMLKRGHPIDEIMEDTELTAEQIKGTAKRSAP